MFRGIIHLPFQIIVFLLLSLMSILSSCSKAGYNQGERNYSRPVHVSQVIVADVPIYIDAIGLLSAEYSVDIKAQVTGKIISANFTDGQFVKKGDILFEIDSSSYKARLNQALAILKQNTAELNIAKWIVDKDKPLAVTGAIASQDYAKIMVAYEKAIGVVEANKAVIWQNQIELEYCKISSPISGITGIRRVDPGNIVVEDNGQTLVNIKAIDPLNVDFTISERNYSILRQSMEKGTLKVIISTESLGEGSDILFAHYYGTLKFLDNTIDPATGNICLRASVPNPDKKIWPGQFVKVRLIYYIKNCALLVPTQAVTMGLKGNFVYRIKDGRAELLWVKTGLKEGDYTIIESIVGDGKIAPGDQVVTVGQIGLVPNSPLNVVGKDTFNLSMFDSTTPLDTKR